MNIGKYLSTKFVCFQGIDDIEYILVQHMYMIQSFKGAYLLRLVTSLHRTTMHMMGIEDHQGSKRALAPIKLSTQWVSYQ